MRAQPPPLTKYATKMRLPIVLLLAFVALYVLAVCTPFGQRLENSMLRGYSSDTWIGKIQYSIGPPPILGEEATFFVGVVLIALAALVRRRWRIAAAGVFVPVATAASAFILNRYVLPRPAIGGAGMDLTESSFPSGHVAITAGVVAGAILVAGPRVRRYVAAVGILWLALIAAAVQNLGWHRGSDALGATLLACLWYAVAARLLPSATQPARLGLAPVVAIAAVGAILGAGRYGYTLEGIPYALIGITCAVLLWFTVAQRTRAAGIVIAVTLVLALVSGSGVTYWRKHSPVHADAGPEPALITGPGTAAKGIKYGKPGAKASIDIWITFDGLNQADFEKTNGATLDALLQDGAVTVTYWPLDSTGGRPQLSNLFAVAAANGKGRSYLRGIYGDFAKAWTNDQLIELGDKLGVAEGKFAAELTSKSYTGWLATINETSLQFPLFNTPSVFVNGKQLQMLHVTPADLKAAIG